MNDMRAAFKKAGINDQKVRSDQKEKTISFFEEKEGHKVLREFLITTDAENNSEKFIKDRPGLTQSQMRKFYGEVLTIDERIKAGTPFEVVKPQIKMIKSKIAYAWSNGSNSKIPLSFKKYMDTMINSINTKEDFNAFKMVFEAVVGFSIGKGARK